MKDFKHIPYTIQLRVEPETGIITNRRELHDIINRLCDQSCSSRSFKMFIQGELEEIKERK